jgi:erythromycin esterase-like protein
MTHGCREHYLWRERVLRQLVETEGFRTIVFEGHAVSMGALDAFVRLGSGSVDEALAETGDWHLANAETADLARWLRAFNEGLPEAERVHVYGCDFQSLDAHVALVRSVVPAAEHPKSLAALPTDSELFSSIEPVMAAIYDPDPDQDRIDSLLEEHGERMKAWRPLVDEVSRWIDSWLDPRSEDAAWAYPITHLGRLFQQTIDFFEFDGDATQRRDAYMAENLLAVRKERSPDRIAFISANLHVSKTAIALPNFGPYGTTGSHLARTLGDGYRCLGAAFHHGEFLAVTDKEPQSDDVATTFSPPPDSLEGHLERYATEVGASALLCDFRSLENEEQLPWGATPIMNIGEAGHPTTVEATFIRQRPHEQFDALYFSRETTPISILPEYYAFQANQSSKGE